MTPKIVKSGGPGTAQAEVEKLKEELASAQTIVNACDQRLGELGDIIDDNNRRIADFHAQIKEGKRRYFGSRTRNQELEENIICLEQDKTRLEAQLALVTDKMMELKEELDSFHEDRCDKQLRRDLRITDEDL